MHINQASQLIMFMKNNSVFVYTRSMTYTMYWNSFIESCWFKLRHDTKIGLKPASIPLTIFYFLILKQIFALKLLNPFRLQMVEFNDTLYKLFCGQVNDILDHT